MDEFYSHRADRMCPFSIWDVCHLISGSDMFKNFRSVFPVKIEMEGWTEGPLCHVLANPGTKWFNLIPHGLNYHKVKPQRLFD